MTFADWLVDEYGQEILDDEVSLELWLEVTDAAMGCSLFNHATGLDAAVAQRVIFEFSSGWRLTWSTEPQRLSLWNIDPVGIPTPASLLTTFVPVHDSGMLECSTPVEEAYDLAAVIRTCCEIFGAPSQIVFPWLSVGLPLSAQDLSESWEAELWDNVCLSLHEAPPTVMRDLLDDASDDGCEPTSMLLFALLRAGVFPTPNEWVPTVGVRVTNGLEELPPNSPLHRFLLWLGDLDMRHKWVVLRDQCCGRCQVEAYDTETHARGLSATVPVLILWADSAPSMIQSDMSVSFTAVVNTTEERELLESTAHERGLSVRTLTDTSSLIFG